MGKVKVLARLWKLEISDMAVSPTFFEIKGLESFTFSAEKTDAPATSFESEGWEEHLVAGRSRSLTAEGFYLEDPNNGERDEGQAIVEEAAEKFGYEGLYDFRLTTPSGTVKNFKGSIGLSDIGGGEKENTKWGFELTTSGKVLIGISAGLTGLTGIEQEAGAALVLIPTFSQDILTYHTEVAGASTWIKLTPTAATGEIRVNNAVTTSGSQTGEIAVAAGELTDVSISVKETDKAAKNYKIVVARP